MHISLLELVTSSILVFIYFQNFEESRNQKIPKSWQISPRPWQLGVFYPSWEIATVRELIRGPNLELKTELYVSIHLFSFGLLFELYYKAQRGSIVWGIFERPSRSFSIHLFSPTCSQLEANRGVAFFTLGGCHFHLLHSHTPFHIISPLSTSFSHPISPFLLHLSTLDPLISFISPLDGLSLHHGCSLLGFGCIFPFFLNSFSFCMDLICVLLLDQAMLG